MPYATPSQVFARSRGRTFTATSKPSTTDVDQYLIDTAAELDGILRARSYTVPVATTATSAFGLLAGYNAIGALATVELSAPSPQGKASEALKLWAECKRMLRAGDIELDAPKDTAQARPRHGAGATSMFATLVEDGA